jgi:hypothetical protein
MEWELTELLLMFLISFKCYIIWFECNDKSSEIDYVFFAYDSLYNHINDVKTALKASIDIEVLKCALYMLNALKNMKITLRWYYEKTALSIVYNNVMILNL